MLSQAYFGAVLAIKLIVIRVFERSNCYHLKQHLLATKHWKQ